MESVVGIFRSAEDARRAAEGLTQLGIPRDRVSVLTPQSSESAVHSGVPTSETEQPGMGKAVGGVVGGVVGASTGAGLGALAATLLVPGFGAVAAAELLGAALLGAGGVAGGMAAGGALEEKVSRGLPKDELYLYENALHSGHSVVLALAKDEESGDRARALLSREGAESLDAARESWWVGLRDAERADYEKEGRDFAAAEPAYRRGFEAAMRRDFSGRSYDDASDDLRDLYPEYHGLDDFRRGFERGRAHGQKLIA
jgi:hypothetical protein